MSGTIQELFTTLREGSKSWLLLFDIDGTLMDTGGKGMAALRNSVIEVFGGEGSPLELAGSTDLGIVKNLYLHFKIDASEEQEWYA